eukprot:3895847-Prymnesium_polylepis.1
MRASGKKTRAYACVLSGRRPRVGGRDARARFTALLKVAKSTSLGTVGLETAFHRVRATSLSGDQSA